MWWIFLCEILFSSLFAYPIDVTIVGPLKFADGIGRISIGIIQCLQGHLKLQVEPRNIFDPQDIEHLADLIPTTIQPSTVAFFTDPLFRHHEWGPSLLNLGRLRIAYTMFESSGLPQSWPHILNTYFDAVVVPDAYLKKVYAQAGVHKPIFVIPCVAFLEEFLQEPLPTLHDPFVFGTSGFFIKRKNQLKLMECFYEEFKNDDDVRLKIHGRASLGIDPTLTKLKEKIQELGLEHKVEIIEKQLSQHDYKAFMKSLDCYVFISQGEGFSFTPCEALALGLPCIITDNTSQTTLCKSGYFVKVPSNIRIPADYSDQFVHIVHGEFFDCKKSDVKKAMRTVYSNYDAHKHQAQQGRTWVRRYLAENLSKMYLNIVKPSRVVLGASNLVTNDYLMTSDKALFIKYNSLYA